MKFRKVFFCLIFLIFPVSNSYGQITKPIEISPEVSKMTNEELTELSLQYDLEYKSREACFELAERHFYGLGATRNLKKAAFYYEVSANPVSGDYFVDRNGVGNRLQKPSPFSDAAYERINYITMLISNSDTLKETID